MRRAANQDRAHRAVVGALRARGALVVVLSQRDVPDLLVGAGGRWVLLEVKSEGVGKEGARWMRGQLSEGQAALLRQALADELPVSVVRTPEEALEAVYGDGTHAYALAQDALREAAEVQQASSTRAKKRASKPYMPPRTRVTTCAVPGCHARPAKGSQWCVVHGESLSVG